MGTLCHLMIVSRLSVISVFLAHPYSLFPPILYCSQSKFLLELFLLYLHFALCMFCLLLPILFRCIFHNQLFLRALCRSLFFPPSPSIAIHSSEVHPCFCTLASLFSSLILSHPLFTSPNPPTVQLGGYR